MGKSKAVRSPKKSAPKEDGEWIKCPDCGKKYLAGKPHVMFCVAHTCTECMSSFQEVVPIYDSREKPPSRLCQKCLDESIERDNADEAARAER